jgi:protein required for attachment to host cells
VLIVRKEVNNERYDYWSRRLDRGLRRNLRTVESHEDFNPKTSEQGSDRPGRVQESAGSARSGVAQTDWHDQQERQFLLRLATRLDEAVRKSETQKLVVIAPPRALGILREAYSPITRQALRGEIAKDYIHMPVYEIEQHLAPAKA